MDGVLEEVQKETLDGREKVKKLKEEQAPHESEEAPFAFDMHGAWS